jgi:broad specificity phosphatase PhoE
MKIVLVRHGRSAHVQAGWLDAAALHGWLTAYDAAGLAPDQAAPTALRELALTAGRIVTSDLPRAVESAALLAPGVEILQSPLLREPPLHIPALGRLRLSFALWGLVIGLVWLRDLRRPDERSHAEPRARAREAARWLAALAETHDPVLVVTHGAFRRYLADALEGSGWRRAPVRRRWHPWSAWELTSPP